MLLILHVIEVFELILLRSGGIYIELSIRDYKPALVKLNGKE